MTVAWESQAFINTSVAIQPDSKPSEMLLQVLANESPRIENSFSYDPWIAIITLIRRFDTVKLFFVPSERWTEADVARSQSLFDFGLALALNPFLGKLQMSSVHPYVVSNPEAIQWTDSCLAFAGRLTFCEQIIDYELAGAIEIWSPEPNQFTYKYTSDSKGGT